MIFKILTAGEAGRKLQQFKVSTLIFKKMLINSVKE
jgi:hypothetical protein